MLSYVGTLIILYGEINIYCITPWYGRTHFRNNFAETNGEVPKYGETLPAFELVSADFKPVENSDFAGKRLVLSIFPSIDTEACSSSVREFNERAAYVEDMVCRMICRSRGSVSARWRVVTVTGFRFTFVMITA